MHKTLVNGTEYDVNGGKALVGGTGYAISKGRTLVGSTGYDISFGTWADRFLRLMANATVIRSGGRSSSSYDEVRLFFTTNDPSGVYYIFTVVDGGSPKLSISKVSWDGNSVTKLSDLYASDINSGSYQTIFLSSSQGSYVWLGYYNARTGITSLDEDNTAGIFALSFSGYAEANIDSILSQFSFQARTGYSSINSKSYVYVADTTTNALLVHYAAGLALSYPYGTVILSNYNRNPSLLSNEYNRYYVAPVDTRDTVYGASIIEL